MNGVLSNHFDTAIAHIVASSHTRQQTEEEHFLDKCMQQFSTRVFCASTKTDAYVKMTRLTQLPTDLLLYIGSFLDWEALCSLCCIAKGMNTVFSHNRLWQPMYTRVWSAPQIGPQSRHKGPITVARCTSATVCKKKSHYIDLVTVPVKRKYLDYKKQFARRLRTEDEHELDRFNRNGENIAYRLMVIERAILGYIEAIERLHESHQYFKRMLKIEEMSTDVLYAWTRPAKRVRKKKNARAVTKIKPDADD